MAADGKTPPTHPQGGGGNIMCTCSIFVCRHKNNDMSTLLGHAHTYIPTDRQTDRQTHRHTYINQYKHIVIPIHGCICVTYPPFGGGVGGNQGGLDHIYILYIYIIYFYIYVHITIEPNVTRHLFWGLWPWIPQVAVPPSCWLQSWRVFPWPPEIIVPIHQTTPWRAQHLYGLIVGSCICLVYVECQVFL